MMLADQQTFYKAALRRDGSPAEFCVCIPARNEARRLPTIINALAQQTFAGIIPVVVSVNNSTDDSVGVLTRLQIEHTDRLSIHIYNLNFPEALAHAGSARRHAMDAGLLVSPNGVLLSTDADTRPPDNWISENLRTIRRGLDLVGGKLVVDQREVLPANILAAKNMWDRYWEIVRGIEDELDPIAYDLPPRHGDHTGASLAITAKRYRAAGGVPVVCFGEDRALVNSAIASGGRLAHPSSVWTYVSPRLDGRAIGGMAKAMTELYETADSGRAPFAPSLERWRERVEWRRQMRGHVDSAARIVREEAKFPVMPCDTSLLEMVGTP